MLMTDEKTAGIGVLDNNVLERNRRRSQRAHISVPVVYEIEDKKWIFAKSINVSETGIRIAAYRRLETGTQLNLEIKLPDMKENFKVRGLVIWSKPSLNRNETWECGIAFENLRHVTNKERMISLIANHHCIEILSCTQGYMTQPADNQEDFLAAYRIVYKEYLKKGYCESNPWKTNYNFHCLLPNSRTFILKNKKKLLGTISLMADSPCRLPMDSIFSQEIDELRQKNAVLAEVGFLALDSSEFQKGLFSLTNMKKQSALFKLYKIILDYAYHKMGATDLIIAVHPKHEILYRYLSFRPFGPVRSYPGANDNLALPMHGSIKKIMGGEDIIFRLGPGKYFFKNTTPMEILNKKMAWSHDLLVDLLSAPKNIWQELNARQREFLEKSYPGLTAAQQEHAVRKANMVPENVIVQSCQSLRMRILNKINSLFAPRKDD